VVNRNIFNVLIECGAWCVVHEVRVMNMMFPMCQRLNWEN